jgi:3-oxoacyl-[acyl-carrier-protein] synthase II
MSNNISACQGAIRLNIRGENAVFSPGADAGAQAIAEGVNTLLEGRACAVLAGGVSEKVSPFSVARARLKGVLNTGSESEGIQCRPFGARRQGTVLGEGCGIVSLELRAAADARDVPYEAVITGYGAAFEVDQGSSPTGNAIARAMNEALERAELRPSDIDVIILHGDGTPIGDRNEISAVQEIFATHVDKIVGFSSKGALGHLSAGAPAVDIILGVWILTHGAIPVTAGAHPLDDSVKFQLTGKSLKGSFKRLMLNCRSFEGHCGSLIIEALR